MKVWWGCACLALGISLALAGCRSNNTAVSITISPPAATVLLNTSFPFISSVSGSSNAVQWSVNGVANGNATVGTISSTGLYTAPATRPAAATGVAVPIIFAAANTSIPNSGSAGSVIELQSGFDLTNFAAGNTINITGNSVAGWNGSFIILFAAQLPNGNFGVQIATPAGPPANGVGGTATATPNITIMAQVQSTNAAASATVSLDSGIRVSANQPSCSIGTNETFTFSATVSGSSNTAVTWSLTGVGTIDPNSGLYTAPATTGTATITASSTADPTESASATVTIVTAADPALTSVNPPTGALGAAFQEIFLSGSNFICTTGVLVNGTPLPAAFLSSLSSSSFLAILPDSVLSIIPIAPATTTTLTFSVQREGGAPQPCSPSPCQLVLSPVRPALVASTPDSIPLPASGSGSFNLTLDGGYFGTTNAGGGFSGTPVVQVRVNGNPVSTPQFSNSDRELLLNVPANTLGSTPSQGLYPITVTNIVSCPPSGTPPCGTGSPNGSIAAANLAVQPTTGPGSPSPITVGNNPSSVGINTATGLAVVANQGSSDITLIDLATQMAVGSPVCTDGGSEPCTARGATGPTSVAVDNIRNLALVANNASGTLAVVNLNFSPPQVAVLPPFLSADSSGNPLTLAPRAVAINPVTGRALVAFTVNASGLPAGGSNAGAILDLTQSPPALINVVNLNNGIFPHIAVSPRLNWALATPGGSGALSIVDLQRQTTNAVSTFRCSAGVVTVTSPTTFSLKVGQPVLISGATPSSFNGIFQAASVSNNTFTFLQQSCASSGSVGTANYALPVATLATNPNVRGVSINDETQKALFADPMSGVPAFVFNILDQTSPLVNGVSPFNNVATAMNPLTNVGLIVNSGSNQAFLVDPVTPAVISSPFSTGSTSPVDVAIDPARNTAVIVNSGTPGSVNLFSLGALRSAPQILQASFAPVGSGQSSSHVTINSTLSSAATAPDQTVTLIGNFPSGSVPRLDGDPSPFSAVTITNGGREMTATLSGSTLAGNGPRMYTLDVTNSSTFSNVAPLQVIQAVSLVTSVCSNPAPQGVAIDATHNLAVVTEPGCNPTGAGEASIVNLSTGTGFGANPELAVGNNPQGVGVYPQSGLAVVANSGSNTVSIVDVLNDDVATTFTVDPIPSGVAVNQGTGSAVVTANGASLVDVFPVSTSSRTPTTIGVQQGPTGVAIDPKNNIAVVANSSGNKASVVNLSTSATTLTSNTITFPQGVAFDPITGNFLITSGALNQVTILNPNSVSALTIRVGIDPSSIAYNFESGTLVTANNLSGTITVVDLIDQTVRGVFSLRNSTQYAVDINLQTNLAVVADTVDNQVLLVPLPH